MASGSPINRRTKFPFIADLLIQSVSPQARRIFGDAHTRTCPQFCVCRVVGRLEWDRRQRDSHCASTYRGNALCAHASAFTAASWSASSTCTHGRVSCGTGCNSTGVGQRICSFLCLLAQPLGVECDRTSGHFLACRHRLPRTSCVFDGQGLRIGVHAPCAGSTRTPLTLAPCAALHGCSDSKQPATATACGASLVLHAPTDKPAGTRSRSSLSLPCTGLQCCARWACPRSRGCAGADTPERLLLSVSAPRLSPLSARRQMAMATKIVSAPLPCFQDWRRIGAYTF